MSMYILYMVSYDTLKNVSAFIIEDRDFFAMYILYKSPNIFISIYLLILDIFLYNEYIN